MNDKASELDRFRLDNEQQLFLDGLQPIDVGRVMGNPHQRSELDRLQRHAEGLGWLATSYHNRYGESPEIVTVRGVDSNGQPFTEVRIR